VVTSTGPQKAELTQPKMDKSTSRPANTGLSTAPGAKKQSLPLGKAEGKMPEDKLN
jgi:hypothetical protein